MCNSQADSPSLLSPYLRRAGHMWDGTQSSIGLTAALAGTSAATLGQKEQDRIVPRSVPPIGQRSTVNTVALHLVSRCKPKFLSKWYGRLWLTASECLPKADLQARAVAQSSGSASGTIEGSNYLISRISALPCERGMRECAYAGLGSNRNLRGRRSRRGDGLCGGVVIGGGLQRSSMAAFPAVRSGARTCSGVHDTTSNCPMGTTGLDWNQQGATGRWAQRDRGATPGPPDQRDRQGHQPQDRRGST
jgi:hypothetical protein